VGVTGPGCHGLVIERAFGRPTLVLLACALFALHALAFGSWLIDDAGISFAYARNLALGHGLTAQAGVPPVEGFSNPLWTLLLAAFARTGWLDPLLTSKLLSLALVALAFLWIATRWEGLDGWATVLPLLLLPLNTSFVIWTTSGLENPLLVLLAVVSCSLAMLAAEGARGSWRLDAGSGLVAGLLALTRPDAIVYSVAYPLVLGLSARGRGTGRILAVRLFRYASAFLPLVGGYLFFRIRYYADWFPNTYHPKDKPSLSSLVDVGKLLDLLESVAGPLAGTLAILFVAGALYLWRCCELRARAHVLFLYLGLATSVYLLMPPDWMGEYRFATAFFVFLYWSLGVVVSGLLRVSSPGPFPRKVAFALSAAIVVMSALLHTGRSIAFAADPVVPFERVAAFSGTGYNRLAAILGREDTSLLTPDMGGTLYYSTLRVYDLAGLCDRTIARSLKTDREAFLRYVFEEARPTFIHVHASWAEWADLSEDPRLRRDYAVIGERYDGPEEWRKTAMPHVPWSADYVRKDALGPDPGVLERLRSAFREQGMPALSP
jgi:hypothetical protein